MFHVGDIYDGGLRLKSIQIMINVSIRAIYHGYGIVGKRLAPEPKDLGSILVLW